MKRVRASCMNYLKFTVFFSSNVEEASRVLVVQDLGVQYSNNAVLQAIPTYSMSCFLLLKVLYEEMERVIAQFWWQKSFKKKGMHWCK